jgi:hypothetical protein
MAEQHRHPALPGLSGDPNGFVIGSDRAYLEDGSTSMRPTLLTVPQASPDGYVLGLYPPYEVQPGDHFQATVSCQQNATGCSALFRVSYLDTAGAPHDLWSLGEFYDGQYFKLDLDLSQLAGQKIQFVLNVGARLARRRPCPVGGSAHRALPGRGPDGPPPDQHRQPQPNAHAGSLADAHGHADAYSAPADHAEPAAIAPADHRFHHLVLQPALQRSLSAPSALISHSPLPGVICIGPSQKHKNKSRRGRRLELLASRLLVQGDLTRPGSSRTSRASE